jgi:signal transduction histidine kinase
LLDFSLPDMDVLEWLKQFDLDSSLNLRPVVVITGGSHTAGKSLLRAGAQDFVGKSWSSPESRTRAVENALERFELMTERDQARSDLTLNESKLKEALAVAENANQAKSEFLTNMSHELRTPLNSILGFAQLMQAAVPQPSPKQTQGLDHIVKAGWYLLRLINETLDLAVIESGVAPTFFEAVSLAEVIQECQELMQPLAQERSIVIDYESIDGRWSVYADQTRVKQILITLLSNAIKYSDYGAVVRVTCERRRVGYVYIAVVDAGAGLSASEISLLFQPFQRLNKTSDTVSGTGMGLAMCKRLTELMHGAIGRSERAHFNKAQ